MLNKYDFVTHLLATPSFDEKLDIFVRRIRGFNVNRNTDNTNDLLALLCFSTLCDMESKESEITEKALSVGLCEQAEMFFNDYQCFEERLSKCIFGFNTNSNQHIQLMFARFRNSGDKTSSASYVLNNIYLWKGWVDAMEAMSKNAREAMRCFQLD